MFNYNSPVVQNMLKHEPNSNTYDMDINTYKPQNSGYNPYPINNNGTQVEYTPNQTWGYTNGYNQYSPQYYQGYTNQYSPQYYQGQYQPQYYQSGYNPTYQYQQPIGHYTGECDMPNPQNFSDDYKYGMFSNYNNPYMFNSYEYQMQLRKEREIQLKVRRLLLNNSFKSAGCELTDEMFDSVFNPKPDEELYEPKRLRIRKNNEDVRRLESNYQYMKDHNIPIVTPAIYERNVMLNNMSRIQSVMKDCDLYEYFTEIHPTLKVMDREEDFYHARKNLANRYNSRDFNSFIDSVPKSDSYYEKLMTDIANGGPIYEDSERGIRVTADEIEVKLPEKFRKTEYCKRREKFLRTILGKE